MSYRGQGKITFQVVTVIGDKWQPASTQPPNKPVVCGLPRQRGSGQESTQIPHQIDQCIFLIHSPLA